MLGAIGPTVEAEVIFALKARVAAIAEDKKPHGM
jgi:hypothetical protein